MYSLVAAAGCDTRQVVGLLGVALHKTGACLQNRAGSQFYVHRCHVQQPLLVGQLPNLELTTATSPKFWTPYPLTSLKHCLLYSSDGLSSKSSIAAG